MKICYLWVDKFLSLENFGINLSSTEVFNYDKVNHAITRKKANVLPDNFFTEGISDVAALIGENGSGKSNCIEFICKALKGGKSRISSDFLIITEEDGWYSYYQRMSSTRQQISPTTNFEVTKILYKSEITGINVIYFSNVFDNRVMGFSRSISDISINNKHKQKTHQRDFLNQISFINSKKFELLEIERPIKVQFEASIFPSNLKLENSNNLRNQLRSIAQIIKIKLKDLTPKSRLASTIRFSYFFQTLSALVVKAPIHDKDLQTLFSDLNTKNGVRTEAASITMLDLLEDYIEKNNLNCDMDIDVINILAQDAKEALVYDAGKSGQKIGFVFDYKSDSMNIINRIVKHFNDSSLFSFSWCGISSGHLAYITLFSSIYSELRRTRNDAIVFIDEGDLYLHPKWQVEFLDKIIKILPNLATGSVQLVFSSHSPFLLSDLPKQCLTILKYENGKTIEKKLPSNTMTFGANLYELYSNVFFLEGLRTGRFAEKKIRELLENHSETVSKEQRKNIKKYQKIIGDKIINHRLGDL